MPHRGEHGDQNDCHDVIAGETYKNSRRTAVDQVQACKGHDRQQHYHAGVVACPVMPGGETQQNTALLEKTVVLKGEVVLSCRTYRGGSFRLIGVNLMSSL